jgi:hypothetical protein
MKVSDGIKLAIGQIIVRISVTVVVLTGLYFMLK